MRAGDDDTANVVALAALDAGIHHTLSAFILTDCHRQTLALPPFASSSSIRSRSLAQTHRACRDGRSNGESRRVRPLDEKAIGSKSADADARSLGGKSV